MEPTAACNDQFFITSGIFLIASVVSKPIFIILKYFYSNNTKLTFNTLKLSVSMTRGFRSNLIDNRKDLDYQRLYYLKVYFNKLLILKYNRFVK